MIGMMWRLVIILFLGVVLGSAGPRWSMAQNDGSQYFDYNSGQFRYPGNNSEIQKVGEQASALARQCLAGNKPSLGDVTRIRRVADALAVPGSIPRQDFIFLADVVLVSWTMTIWC
jgi:hypothetical protein